MRHVRITANMPAMTTTCPKCGGSGKLADPRDEGAAVRRMRLAAGLTLRAVAQRAHLSAAYLCDLELGRRAWNAGNRARIRRAIEA